MVVRSGMDILVIFASVASRIGSGDLKIGTCEAWQISLPDRLRGRTVFEISVLSFRADRWCVPTSRTNPPLGNTIIVSADTSFTLIASVAPSHRSQSG